MSAFQDGLTTHRLASVDAEVILMPDGRVRINVADCDGIDMDTSSGDAGAGITMTAAAAQELGHVLHMAALHLEVIAVKRRRSKA